MLRSAFRTAALASLVLATAACDTTSGTEPLGGILYVSLESATTIRLESSFDLPCGPRIADRAATSSAGASRSPCSASRPGRADCTGVAPVTRTVTLERGGAATLPVDIIFGGFVDEYRYSAGRAGSTAGPAGLGPHGRDASRADGRA